METGTQYDEHDVTMRTDYDDDVTHRTHDVTLMGELSERGSTCTSGSDGFMFTSDYDTPHNLRMGVTEL